MVSQTSFLTKDYLKAEEEECRIWSCFVPLKKRTCLMLTDQTVARLVILPAARADLIEFGDSMALDNPERALW